MTRPFCALLLLALAVLPGCPQSCQQVTPTGDEIVDCAKESGRDIFHTLIPRVTTVIAVGPDFGTVTIELAKLVAEYGVDVVTCVVDAVRDRNAQAAAVASGDEKVLHERGTEWAKQWLAEHGAEIKTE